MRGDVVANNSWIGIENGLARYLGTSEVTGEKKRVGHVLSNQVLNLGYEEEERRKEEIREGRFDEI